MSFTAGLICGALAAVAGIAIAIVVIARDIDLDHDLR